MKASTEPNRTASIVKALTIRQPWAWCITRGSKRVENRRWRTKYRGPLVLHAGRSREAMSPESWHLLRRAGIDRPADADIAFGAIVGVCRIVDCVAREDTADDVWAVGPWCFQLARVHALPEPIPLAGNRGLFDVDLQEECLQSLRHLLAGISEDCC